MNLMYYPNKLTTTNYIYVLITLVVLFIAIEYIPRLYTVDNPGEYMSKLQKLFNCINESNTTRILFGLLLGVVMLISMCAIGFLRDRKLCCQAPGIIQDGILSSEKSSMVEGGIKSTGQDRLISGQNTRPDTFHSMRY